MTSPRGKRKLVLVDGNSLLYRSFFAMPRLTNREGTPTNAVYGFAMVLRKLLAEEKPELTAVVFDAPGKTFRHELYKEYKANRPETPDDLSVQFPHARTLCRVLGFPILEIEGVEADDVIGTLCARGAETGLQVFAVSSDKDFLQLVSDSVTIINPGKEIRYDAKAVCDKFGVPPDRVIDVLALMGDSVDNVPGVPGIGQKGAVGLIQKWGSVEGCLENIEKISNKRQREGLREHREQALLSKTLVRIATDLSIDVEMDELRYRGAEREEAFAFFDKLGFTTLLKDYLPTDAAESVASIQKIDSSSELKRLLEKAQASGKIALSPLLSDETDLTSPLLGLGLAVEPGAAFFVPVSDKWSEADLLSRMKVVLADAAVAKCGADLKATWKTLTHRSLELRRAGFDTTIASYVLNPSKRSHGLEELAMEFLQRPIAQSPDRAEEQEVLPGFGAAPSDSDLRHAAEMAETVLSLQRRLETRLREEGLTSVFQDIELPLIEVLADMERLGIGLDVNLLRAMSKEVGKELEGLTAEIYELAGAEFNINSPKQLGEILFEKMNLPSFRKTQKQRAASTRMEVLEELAVHFELPKKVLEYRSLSKLKGTYIDALPALVDSETSRIHTSFNQTVAATGRLSSSDPNLQNIPIRTELGRRIRGAFIAEPGWQLLSADYSQIELRVLAHMSGDPSLIEAFQSGEDIHERTAARVFGGDSELSEKEQRRRAKIINFSIIYGKTAFTLGKDLGVSTREAQAFIDAYFERHPKVQELLDKIIKEARLTGKVKTLFGRHRYIPEIGSRNRNTRQAAERVAVNAPIQGTAADLIKKAMVELWNELNERRLRSRLLLQVHDELVLEVPQEETETVSKLVRDTMEEVYPLQVPLKVDLSIGSSWLH
jgi:DNA polymerase-1